MPRFGAPIDLNKYELQNVRLQNLATAPAAPVSGQEYFDSALGHAYVYNGTGWEQASGGGGSGSVTTVSVVSANGLAGSVANAASTPAITLTTTITGLLKGNGTAISAAAGTDLPALNTITAPAADLSLNTHRITNLLDPTAAQDAATKNYVDITAQGLDAKPTATVATAAALPALTYANGTSGVGATLTASANGALTVDGYGVAATDLVLVKSQVAGLQNGLYTVTQPGTGSTPFILTRHTAMDTAAEFTTAFVVVEDAGATNANTLWVCTNSAAPTVGTTAITFTQLNAATSLVAGTGITISGNTVSINTAYVGQASITTLGTIATGTWNGTTIALANGGTGATTATGARQAVAATGVYSAAGTGTATTFVVTRATHGLGTVGALYLDVSATVYDKTANPAVAIYPDISINTTTGDVTFTFGSSQVLTNYQFTLIGK
jgi:hypothetical protein